MRTIKFRAWDKNNLRMLEHEQLLKSSPYYQSPFTRDDIELMQFTGLLDKNGKEIYEGDIIQNEFGKKIVTWCDGGFYCDEEKTIMRIYFWLLELSKIKVIGNIYENPELLS